jgi:hypothetical protein
LAKFRFLNGTGIRDVPETDLAQYQAGSISESEIWRYTMKKCFPLLNFGRSTGIFLLLNISYSTVSYSFFVPSVLRSRSIFVRLWLVKNFSSGSFPLPHIFKKKFISFHGFKKTSCFLKPLMIMKTFFKVNSYEKILF